jgi:hypothetical protein
MMKILASLATMITIGAAFIFPAMAISPSLKTAVVDLRGLRVGKLPEVEYVEGCS